MGKYQNKNLKLFLKKWTSITKLKEKVHFKQSGLSETEKKKLIEEGKTQALGAIPKKDKRCISLFKKCVFVNDSPPKY